MNSLITKFFTGLKTDVKGTTIRAIHYSLRLTGDFLADVLYFVIKLLLLPMPPRTLARLKNSLSPVIRLDYKDAPIKLKAESLVDFYRARACEKEPETVDWIRNYLRPGEILYDIGANIGAYSLIACAYTHGKAIVHAFEPSFSTYAQLSRNIILNGWQANIIPHLIGLADYTGTAVFSYKSLEAGSADHWLDKAAPPNSTSYIYTQQVLAIRVDDLINKFEFPAPDHIKLDVDGSEVSVLRGASETLRNKKLKSILVEVRDVDGLKDQVDELLVAAGFHLVSRTDRGDHVTWNCIYAREHRIPAPTYES